MVHTGKERCGGKINQFVVWIEWERDVVRNPEDAIAATDHSFVVPAIGKSKTRRKLLLVQGEVIPACVGECPDQGRVADTRRSRSTVATSDGGIDERRIPEAQTVITVRPRTLKFIAESRVQRQFRSDMPVITSVKRTIGLTTSRLGWNLGGAFCLVHEGGRPKLA